MDRPKPSSVRGLEVLGWTFVAQLQYQRLSLARLTRLFRTRLFLIFPQVADVGIRLRCNLTSSGAFGSRVQGRRKTSLRLRKLAQDQEDPGLAEGLYRPGDENRSPLTSVKSFAISQSGRERNRRLHNQGEGRRAWRRLGKAWECAWKMCRPMK
jgi:hypothetical protein